MEENLIATAVLFTALPFNFDGVTPTVSKAHAIIGRPLTPFSVAGVHRRAVRRAYGIGANLGYRGFYHRNFGSYAYNRFGYGTAAYGAGWGRRLGRLGLESASLQQRSHRLGRRLGLESPLASVAIDNRWNG